ncbi:hypothetical protein L210DRAFT_383798 [Boletus edulis BED1]|uniref:Uncharacterized protein n=1 Tax=Boletus edulis BED1 TaxID=1328754 RepID=A0AAD4GEJ8_BOLED|nr:hypothetical protein L210DRAFT_383798 [Boletus edulis BED1]
MAPSEKVTLGISFIGYTGAMFLTGISLGQGYAYIRWFPNERRLQRMAVLGVIILDFLYTAVALEVTWEQLISCRRGISDACAEGNSWESFVSRVFTF